jgi:hypothetical protein
MRLRGYSRFEVSGPIWHPDGVSSARSDEIRAARNPLTVLTDDDMLPRRLPTGQ